MCCRRQEWSHEDSADCTRRLRAVADGERGRLENVEDGDDGLDEAFAGTEPWSGADWLQLAWLRSNLPRRHYIPIHTHSPIPHIFYIYTIHRIT